ncbi:MAG: hypothetical protein HRU35_03485 [Rickettsiaceae bacterium]|nr:hypothetical protein [Rickettsiaceae bacterium]
MNKSFLILIAIFILNSCAVITNKRVLSNKQLDEVQSNKKATIVYTARIYDGARNFHIPDITWEPSDEDKITWRDTNNWLLSCYTITNKKEKGRIAKGDRMYAEVCIVEPGVHKLKKLKYYKNIQAGYIEAIPKELHAGKTEVLSFNIKPGEVLYLGDIHIGYAFRMWKVNIIDKFNEIHDNFEFELGPLHQRLKRPTLENNLRFIRR